MDEMEGSLIMKHYHADLKSLTDMKSIKGEWDMETETAPPVTNILSKLDKEMEIAAEAHKKMRARLSPVLRQDKLAEEHPTAAPLGGTSDLANTLSILLSRLESLNEGMFEMVERLEI